MRSLAFSRYAFSVCAAAALLSGCGMRGSDTALMPPAVREAALPHGRTFYFTGRRQTFIVPAGVTRLTFVALGAAGGGPIGLMTGRGGRISGILPVAPAEKLVVFVGGQGSYLSGGFNGGANGGTDLLSSYTGFGGGGASDVRKGDALLVHRVLIVGGGGGQGAATYNPGGAGGDGGGLIGEKGGNGGGPYAGHGGGGGKQYIGGAGGYGGGGGSFGFSGGPGSLGAGGLGGGCGSSPSCALAGAGGGGGGGYYGGGGGGQGGAQSDSYNSGGGGGGGGSSFAASNTLDFHSWQGWYSATHDGLVVVSWR